MTTRVYLDHNATTPLHDEVREVMTRALAEGWGNPSSHHWAGRTARTLVDAGRAGVAEAIAAHPSEIVFCSGASEADNLAIRGICAGAPRDGRDTIVLSAVEHPAVAAAAAECVTRGWRVVEVPVLDTGALDLEALARAVDAHTKLVSVMAINNETGVIFPIAAIGEIAHRAGALFHCDGVQALGKLAVDVNAWNIDLLSLTAHKCGGPKGIGALWVRRGVHPAPLVVGGSQERDRRAGTENVPGIAGFGAAARIAAAAQPTYARRIAPLRDRFEKDVVAAIPGSTVHGARTERAANTSYFSFAGVMGENVLLALDLEGIAVSGGSACASGAMHPSKTLQAMGIPAGVALGAVRFSLGFSTTAAEIDRVLAVLPALVERQRAQAPRSHEASR